MITVMGATGHVGSQVASLLLDAGEEIRVLQHGREPTALRDAGAEVVQGDAMLAEELMPLFDGAASALVLLPENLADPRFVEHRVVMSRAVGDALRRTGVQHVVALSTVGADRADVPGPPAGLYRFERDLAELGDANVSVLRSAAYMDYLLAALPMIREQHVNGSAVRGDVRFPMVATQDVAREAAERLRLRDTIGHEVRYLLGPEDITMAEATTAIGTRIGMPDLPYVEFPPDGVRAALAGAGMSEEVAGLIVDLQLARNEGVAFRVERTAASTTPTRLEDFLDQALAQGADAR
jgi:uncharacterized protein YbjT (DUF2867 family)